jgi:hypothetical protein
MVIPWGCADFGHYLVESVDYRKNDFVYVRPPGLELDGDDDERKFYVAQILEIRANDPCQVFALVAWMYWPDQLVNAHVGAEKPMSLRRWYHGKHELIASNHLDIEDVTSLAGLAPVAQWLEEYDDKVQEGLYWRQTFNALDGNLSVCTPGNRDNKYLSNFEFGTGSPKALHLQEILQPRCHPCGLPEQRVWHLDARGVYCQ